MREKITLHYDGMLSGIGCSCRFAGMVIAFVLLFMVVSSLYASGKTVPNLLFSVDFDDYMTTASFAKGDRKSVGFKDADLQLRMYKGANDKGNALCLDGMERCSWKLPGNFDPKQGSVVLWVSPIDWTPAESKRRIVLFEARQPNFLLFLQKGEGLNFISVAFLLNGRNRCIVHANVDISTWQKKSWHQIVLTWNQDSVKLYTDGRLAKPYRPTGKLHAMSEMTFHESVKWPDAAPNGEIHIGNNNRVRAEISGSTAFDSVRIYNRCLQAVEISEDYEKVFPPKKKTSEPFILTIPKAPTDITLDGTLKPEEWKDAVAMPLLKAFAIADHKMQADAKMYLKHNGKDLFIGFSTDRPCTKYSHTEHDSNIFNDDVFEFHANDSQGKDIWLCVNAIGAIFDAKDSDRSWESGAVASAKRNEKGWSVELKIPLKAFDMPAPGERREANFWGLCFEDAPNYYHSWYGTPHNRSGAGGGYIIFGGDECFTAFEPRQSIFNGYLDLDVRSAGTPVDIVCDNVSKTIKGADKIEMKLQPGRHNLTIRQKDKKGNTAFSYNYDFNSVPPMLLSYKAYPLRKTIETVIDLNGAGQEILTAAEEGKLTCKVELKNASGLVVSKAECKPRSITHVNLPLPGDMASGTYEIRAQVENTSLSAGASMRVPDAAPYKAKVALDHEVPQPWHNMEYRKNNSFGVLDREYRFAKSPFPAGVISRGRELVAEPFQLLCDGKVVEWDSFEIGEKYTDYVTFTGSGHCGNFSFSWKGELWFDGFYKLDLNMDPGRETTVKSLKLNFSIPAEYGKYFICSNPNPMLRGLVTIPWQDNRITGGLNIQDAHWLTGSEVGFMWMPLDTANWVVGKEPVVQMTRGQRTVDVTLNMVGKEAKLSRAARYSLAFMGTPARRPIKGIRNFNLNGYLIPPHQTADICGNSTLKDGLAYGYCSHVFMTPDKFRNRLLKRYERRGVKLFVYELPAGISEYDSEFDYWLPTWRRMPGYSLSGNGYTCIQCCSPELADLISYRLDKLYSENPELGGLYYDLCKVEPCNNEEHGHGGTDAFGQKITSSNAMHLREYLLRVYKVSQRHGKRLINHFHNYFNPITHNFSDFYYPGENDVWMYGANPEWYYCEVPAEEYEAAWSTVIRGAGIVRCTQITRTPMYVKSLRELYKANPGLKEEIALRSLTPCWIYDFNSDAGWLDRTVVEKYWTLRSKLKLDDAVFHGYWHEGNLVSSKTSGNRVSWYELPPSCGYTRLIAIGNFTRKEQAAGITLVPGQLNLNQESLVLENLETGKPVSLNELPGIMIPANHCLLVGVKAQ